MKPGDLLLTVEEVFAIAGHGVMVAPGVVAGPRARHALTVELTRPDGTTRTAAAQAVLEMLDPCDPRNVEPTGQHMLMFAELTKADVPPGTQIRLVALDW